MSIQPALTNDPAYREFLREALNSHPYPSQSGFNVHAIGVTKSGLKIIGGNHEYGITSAIHAEESLRANWAEKAGPKDLIETLGFATKEDSEMFFPCGNCRDVLKDIISPTGNMIYGNPDGKMEKLPLYKLYSDDHKKLHGINVTAQLQRLVDDALDSLNKSYDYTLSDKNKNSLYAASIQTKSGEIFSAGFEGDIAYHPSLPIRNAQILLKHSPGITENRLSIDKLVIVQKTKPYVPYKDRQYLTEFVEASNFFLGKNNYSNPVPIYLFEVEDDGKIKNRWRTFSSDWLPFPFSPKALGFQNELKNSIDKLFR